MTEWIDLPTFGYFTWLSVPMCNYVKDEGWPIWYDLYISISYCNSFLIPIFIFRMLNLANFSNSLLVLSIKDATWIVNTQYQWLQA
jgi:hypothetical protein